MATDRKPVMTYLDEETLKWLDKYCYFCGYRRKDKATGKTESRLGTGLLKIARIYLSKWVDADDTEVDDAPKLETPIKDDRIAALEERIAQLEKKVYFPEPDKEVAIDGTQWGALVNEAILKLQENVDYLLDCRDDRLEIPQKADDLISEETIETTEEDESKISESIILLEENTIPLEEITILIEDDGLPQWKVMPLTHEELIARYPDLYVYYHEQKWIVEEFFSDDRFRGWMGQRGYIAETIDKAQTYSRKRDAQRAIDKLLELAPTRRFRIVPVLV